MPYFCHDSLKLHYTDSQVNNNPNAPVVLALHGLSESHLYWSLTGIVDTLNQAGYRVISLDMRGHGFTEVNGEQKGYSVWNGRLGYSLPSGLSFGLWGKNLFNKEYAELRFDSNAIAAVTELKGERRQIGVDVTYEF